MKRSERHPRIQTNFVLLGLGLWVLVLLVGCASGYGSLRRDPTVAQEFEANQVPTSYRYYVNGYASKPYAIAGIDPTYEMPSKLWKTVEPNTDAFKESVRWVWEDYGYTIFGADILDTAGNKIGVWYSALWNVTVKFTKDNRIYLLTDHPYLGGPDEGDSRAP
jgi:hypothetical protein